MSDKSKSTTFLLCYFLGALGVHRFYLGKLITGLLMLLTLGGLLIWWLIDLYLIITGRLKDKQGQELSTAPPHADQPNAGFWVRVSAMIIDALVLGVIVFVFIELPLIAFLFNKGIFTANMQDPQAAQMAMLSIAPIMTAASGLIMLLYVGYFVVLTAGKHQGTYGKRSMGIYVQRRDGGRVGFGHSLVRFVGYIISSLILGLGYLMAAFNKRKLALHDIIAGTEVIYGSPSGETAAERSDAVTEVMHPEPEPEPEPLPVGMHADARPSRVPEILVVTGVLLIAGAAALNYML